MTATLDIAVTGLDQALRTADALASIAAVEIADAIGALGVRQTQRRIASEKTSPAGAAWKKNISGTSILFRSGALAASISHRASAAGASWGSPLIYAAIHNYGGVIKPKTKKALRFPLRGRQDQHIRKSVTMPKREYLGISAENAAEMERMVVDLVKVRLP